MTAAPSPEPHAGGSAKRVVGFTKGLFRGAMALFGVLVSLIGFLIIVFGPFQLLLNLQSNQELKQGAAFDQVSFYLFEGGVLLLLFVLVTRTLVKQPERAYVWTAAGYTYVLLSATAIVLSNLAQLAAVLARNGTKISVHPAQSELRMGDLYQKFLFESLEAVPGLEIPRTLGWEDPISDPAWPLGLMLLIAKVVVLLLFISTVFALIRAVPRMRFRRKPAQAQTSGEQRIEEHSASDRPGGEQRTSNPSEEASTPPTAD